MSVLGVDYSYARPAPAEIRAAGYGFVMRYLSNEPAKNISTGELAALHAAGLMVGFVWEAQAGDPEGGAPSGTVDGATAGNLMRALGVPTSVPVFWALDVDDRGDPNWKVQTNAYNQAFREAVGGYAPWPYGSVRLIDEFGGGWQTEAWSDGAVSPHAFLLQYAEGSLIPETDKNVLFNADVLYPPTPTDWFDMASKQDLIDVINQVVPGIVAKTLAAYMSQDIAQGQKSWVNTQLAEYEMVQDIHAKVVGK